MQELLDLGDGDLLAAAVDHVLDPPGDPDVAARVDPGQVTGPIPAIFGDYLSGQGRAVQGAHEQTVGVDLEVALLAGAQEPPLVIDDSKADPVKGSPVGAPRELWRIAGRERA